MAAVFVSLRSRYLLLVLVLSILTTFSWGLQVTPGSACASYCLDDANGDALNPNDSTTTASDIVCNNVDYWSTTKGTKFRTCINCLQNSTAVNGTESDTAWYLYNLRYAVDVCLFSFPSSDSSNTSTSSPCALESNCPTLSTALETGSLNPANETEFQYCSADGGAFGGSTLTSCIQCLQADTQQTYLSNFLTALSAGCKQQPPTGDLLGLNGTLFTTSAVSIITPSWNQTDPGPATPVTTLTTGTIVGIAVGAALLLFGALALFYLYWRRQKRERNYQFSDAPPTSGPFRPVQSISSSITGGYVPFYTTDYKKPVSDQRNIELYDKIKTQDVVIPAKKNYDKEFPETASLWGHDTPYLTRQQLLSGPRSSTPSSQQLLINNNDTSQNLADMPTHPAFIPRAFTRASRNPSALAQTYVRVKSNKPDTYAIQRYLDAAEDTSTVDVASLISPPLPTSNTYNTTNSAASNPFSNPQDSPNVPPPPSGSPPANGPKIPPSLVLPSLSRVRSPKKYIPPPLNIEESKPKAQRINGSDPESGMP